MRVKDIMGNNRNVKLEQVEVTYQGNENYTCYWYKELRLVLTEDQIKQYNALQK
jgi:hypothetical protein